MGMKKITAVFAAILLSGIAISPASANAEKSIAIIDSFVDTTNISNSVAHCFDAACSVGRADKHGTQMAEIVRQNNSSAMIIGISAGVTKAGPVNSIGLSKALKWVLDNADVYSIGVVSVSLNAGNSSLQGCKPKATGVNVNILDNEIISYINFLDAKGIAVVAAAGNGSNRAQLDYPACISNVVAVTAPLRQGTTNSVLDFLVRTSVTNAKTSFGVVSYKTTSAVTALVAARWSNISSSPRNAASQIRLDAVK